MSITVSFGNLSVDQMEKRIGAEFSDDDRQWLYDHKTDTAGFTEKDKFHIFDMPFKMICGDDIVRDVIKILTKYNNAKPFEKNLVIESKS